MTAEGLGNTVWFHVCLSAAMEAPGALLVFHRSYDLLGQEVSTLCRSEPGKTWWPEGPKLGSKSDLPAWTLPVLPVSVWVPSVAVSVDGCQSS